MFDLPAARGDLEQRWNSTVPGLAEAFSSLIRTPVEQRSAALRLGSMEERRKKPTDGTDYLCLSPSMERQPTGANGSLGRAFGAPAAIKDYRGSSNAQVL